MMNLDFVCNVIEATSKYKFVRYHMYSNGTLEDEFRQLLDKPFIEDIKDRMHIQLSYDGEPQHELKRGYSHEKVFKTMHLLLDAGITAYFKATLTFDMISSLEHIWDSYKLAYDEFGDVVSYSPTLDTELTDDSMLDEWKAQMKKIAKKEYVFINQHHRPLMSWFSSHGKKNCMLKDSCHMHNDGNIYICHGCPYLDDCSKFKLGDVFSIQTLDDCLVSDIDLDEVPDACKRCEATHCAVCHIDHLHESNNVIRDWVKNKANNQKRCQFFKEFGKIHRMLEFKLMEDKKNACNS